MNNPAIIKYQALFGSKPDIVVSSPGRINLIGEHTDYNGGLVMPAAINMYMTMALGVKNASSRVDIHTMLVDETISFDLNNIQNQNEGWVEHFKGICKVFLKNGFELNGMNCVVHSDIPLGAGVSSSSALECAFLKGVDHLFNCNLNDWVLIDYSQWANHHYLGVQGGILDQFAILFGKEAMAIKMNCATRDYKYLPASIEGYSWVLINTNVKHNHLESGYNDRVRECNEALSQIQNQNPEIENLSEVQLNELPSLFSYLEEVPYKRLKFIVEENDRVKRFKTAITDQDLELVSKLLIMSHEGLRDLYEVSCEELDFLVDFMKGVDSVVGSRMMGGGFGGCTINLIKANEIEQVCKSCQAAYKESFNKEADYFVVDLSNSCQVFSVE